MRKQAELDNVWIICVKRLNNSINGNPRYDITFTDGDLGSWTYRTSSDSSCAYDVENLFRSSARVNVYVTRHGYIYGLERV